jgi:hypothetical protein
MEWTTTVKEEPICTTRDDEDAAGSAFILPESVQSVESLRPKVEANSDEEEVADGNTESNQVTNSTRVNPTNDGVVGSPRVKCEIGSDEEIVEESVEEVEDVKPNVEVESDEEGEEFIYGAGSSQPKVEVDSDEEGVDGAMNSLDGCSSTGYDDAIQHNQPVVEVELAEEIVESIEVDEGPSLGHPNIRAGDGRISCEECDEVFTQSSDFVQHSLVHAAFVVHEPFKCLECGKGFTRSSSLSSNSPGFACSTPLVCHH